MRSIWGLCSLIAIASCGDNADSPATVEVTISGLDGSGLVLVLNGGDELPVVQDGTYAFRTPLPYGTAYEITVGKHPTEPTQTCMVAKGTGTVGVQPIAIAVTCHTDAFAVSGIVTGLEGSGLVLENNGTDTLAIAGNGPFMFPAPVASGTAFAVTVATRPSGPTQTCMVAGGSGTIGDGPVTTVVVNCATDRFTVGGIVAGLDGTVVLQNNGGDPITLTANGSFAFPTTVASGASYAVTVLTNPTAPAQTCIVTSGTGSVVDAAITSVRVQCATNAYAIRGTVSGLDGSGLVLQNNAGDDLAISADGAFAFPTPVASSAPYAVTVLAQPASPTQHCTVTNGGGTVGGADVTNVDIQCVTTRFTVGGSVSGLVGSGLVLRNNGGDDLAVSVDGTWAFATPIASGAAYAVTIAAQPASPTQTCTVAGGTGTVGAGAVTSVAINCTTNQYAIGGTISGLLGTVRLRNNGGDELVLTANGTFAFATPIDSGATYAVTVAADPTTPSQTCVVTAGTGTVGAGAVTSVNVACTTNRYTVGGTVTGLAGSGLVLRVNNGDDLAVSGSTFTFATSIESGTAYAVTVAADPSNLSQTCTVANSSGTIGGANVTDVAVTCTTNTYAVGGTVSGLAGGGLVLRNNAGDDFAVTANGTFTFGTRVASGGSYAVTVAADPMLPWQTCVVTSGTGTVTNADITGVTVTCTTNRYTVGGTVSGLAGSGLVLSNNGQDLAVTGTSFTFPAQDSGTSFAVTVKTQPSLPTQTCVVSGDTGTVGGGNVTSVVVNCTTQRYTVGGTVSGLSGTLVLRNNGGDDRTITADGTFAFATTVASGAPYSVTVATDPTSPIKQTCVVSAGSGTVTSANVTDVAVTCTTDRFAVRATVVGLAANSQVVLRNNGANDLTATSNGTFTFTTTVPSGGTYAVTVHANPTSPIAQTCTATNDSGTIGSTDVTATITCVTNRYVISANVTGLPANETVVLQNNGTDDVTFTANGASSFATTIASGAPYNVTVKTHPTSKVCHVSNGAGTVGANSVTVEVSCVNECFRFTNTAAEDLTNNNWFDLCASLPGNTVRFTLRDTNGTVVYDQSGPKGGTWSPSNLLTSTNPDMFNQFYSPNHDRMIALGNTDRVMIPGKGANNAGCGGSLGDGYGIVIYNATPSYNTNIKLMVQPYRQMNYDAGAARYFIPTWTPSYEITWNNGALMNSCSSLMPFLGTFSVSITP